MAMIIVALTQHPLKAIFRGQGNMLAGHASAESRLGGRHDRRLAQHDRHRVATGAAGIIIGTLSLTGAHQVVSENSSSSWPAAT